jgi:hypothetical protein
MAFPSKSQAIRNQRGRFWFETVVAMLTAALCVLTLVWSAWIEAVFAVDPDGANGALEWALVSVFASASVTLGVLAGRSGLGQSSSQTRELFHP